MITIKEQQIYNLYLKSVRNGKGYQPRKNFDGFEEDKSYPFLKKLVLFFDKHPNISPEMFFISPYKIHSDERYLSLDWYLTPSAIKMYQSYRLMLLDEGPDTDSNCTEIKKSIIFIMNFCKEKNISISNYITNKTGYVPSFLMHLKNRDVTPYVLFYFQGMEKEIYRLEDDLLTMMLGKDYIKTLDKYKSLYYNSKKAKPIIELIFKKLKGNEIPI